MKFEFNHQQHNAAESSQVVLWLKSVGDEVAEGEELLHVETNKAEVVVYSPVTGRLEEIIAEVGDEVFDGDQLAVFEATEAAV